MPTFAFRSLERFLRTESGSATLLMLAAVVALVWANLPGASYDRLWETGISLQIGDWSFSEDLRHLVNDLLMAVFFYVVALEVKRELHSGSLRERRSAAVPAAAAFGTMVGAALTYVAVNLIGDGDLRGWAIPIATDIAFAVGALGLAGRRAPTELRAFMLTLAVVDDLGTIAVIAVFFTDGLSLAWLGISAVLVAAVLVARRLAVGALAVYVLLAVGLWLAVFESGVHPTLAGVALGFLTPAVARASPRRAGNPRLAEPMEQLLVRLHPWSAYAILPIFALANAGVPVSVGELGRALGSPVGLGILLGLVVGAPLGGFLFARASVYSGIGRVPDGLDWSGIASVTPLKGIGFTIAIFIAELAFDEAELVDRAKLSILIASALAAAIGLSLILARAHVVATGSLASRRSRAGAARP